MTLFRNHFVQLLVVLLAFLLSSLLLLSPDLPNKIHEVAAKTPRAATDDFVTRSGPHLMLNGDPFRFSGPNINWLLLDDREGKVTYPSQFRIDDAFATAKEMGANVVRSHAAAATGCPLCIQPTRDEFNETALKRLDYIIKSARDHEVRLILPLTDNYHYYRGGKHNFTDWRGIADEKQFYYDASVINDFKRYVSVILNRVNSYTGIAYKDDSTILAWETGNELNPPISWTKAIADYMNMIDARHLIVDGKDLRRGIDMDALALDNVDLYSDHIYPIRVERLTEVAKLVRSANKALIVGEYDWVNKRGGDPLTDFLGAIEVNAVAGDFFWLLYGHQDFLGYVTHAEGFTLHYPGDTHGMRQRAQALRAHAYAMRGKPVPVHSVPGAPLITMAGGNIAWRGVAGAYKYTVERSSVSPRGPWEVICSQCATDNDTPWKEQSRPTDKAWYRVKAHNMAGVGGPYSPVYEYKQGTNEQPIPSFTLINADTDQPIAEFDPLTNGVTLNLATLPTRNLNIRANIHNTHGAVESVRLMLEGTPYRRDEASAPYALAGDEEGNYYAWTPLVGSYTLRATPYTLSGTVGMQQRISFHVIDRH